MNATAMELKQVAERPMLSRAAASLYWMGRYVERSEHVARLLLESQTVMTDVGELSTKSREQLWDGVLRTFNTDGHVTNANQAMRFMAIDRDNSNSIVSCLVRVRENARGVRESISAEMWESLNSQYWALQGADALIEENPQQLCNQIIIASALMQGLADQTLAHGQGWLFNRLGKYFERIDMTCRIIDAKLQVSGEIDDPEAATVHWLSLLRSCGALEGYRRKHVGDLEPSRVISFILLDRAFPRSIGHCVAHAFEAVSRIRSGIAPHAVDTAERFLGRLDTQLTFAEVSDILAEGIPVYLERIRSAASQAADAVRSAYFQE